MNFLVEQESMGPLEKERKKTFWPCRGLGHYPIDIFQMSLLIRKLEDSQQEIMREKLI
jgi:hypothetical protein